MSGMSGSHNWDEVCEMLRRGAVTATRDAPLGLRTTYRVGGTAAITADVTSVQDLHQIAQVIRDFNLTDVIVVGNGSNLLVSDNGYHGLAVVLHTLGSNDITIVDDTDVVASGHLSLPQVARQTVAAHRCGLEWAVGVPGTVGGGVRMNAGGHGSDMASSLVSIHLLDLMSGYSAHIGAADLGLRFRGSCLSDHHVVVSARFVTTEPQRHNGRSCNDELTEIVRWRRENQPGGQNAGSVFVNPGKDSTSAGALIDRAGLRGTRLRTAVVTDKHANFIQSDVAGSADDVIELMCLVQDAVREKHGVTMRSEIRLVGFAPELSARFLGSEVDDPIWVATAGRLETLLRDGVSNS